MKYGAVCWWLICRCNFAFFATHYNDVEHDNEIIYFANGYGHLLSMREETRGNAGYGYETHRGHWNCPDETLNSNASTHNKKRCLRAQRFASVQGQTWLSIDDNPANNDGLIHATSSITSQEASQLRMGWGGGFWVFTDRFFNAFNSLFAKRALLRQTIALWLPVICGAGRTSAVHCASTQINGLLSSEREMGGPHRRQETKTCLHPNRGDREKPSDGLL